MHNKQPTSCSCRLIRWACGSGGFSSITHADWRQNAMVSPCNGTVKNTGGVRTKPVQSAVVMVNVRTTAKSLGMSASRDQHRPPSTNNGESMCPAKHVPALEQESSEQQNSQNLHGSALEELCRLMHEQNRILLNLSSQLSLMMQSMAEDQGSEDGGFTSLEQT